MTLGVGIIGTGRMATAFAESLAQTNKLRPLAVLSRSAGRAGEFAAHHGMSAAYASRAELVADRDVDLVYIATPHSCHAADSIACIEAGKAVLCEKPFAINATEAGKMVSAARQNGVFLMEAMWTRFLPSLVRLRELLAADAIGEPQVLIAGGAFQPVPDPENYLWNPALGGGVLLDAGVYPVSLASMLLGKPSAVLATGLVGDFGVDEQDGVLLQHAGGATALLYVSLRASKSPDVTILGRRGSIYLHPPMFAPTRLELRLDGKAPETVELGFEGNGYHYQAEAVADAMRAGRLESEVMPLDESLEIMRTLDRIREQVGTR